MAIRDTSGVVPDGLGITPTKLRPDETHVEAMAARLPGGIVIVTVTPTMQDGTVVRWYLTEAAAETGREVVSASRNGVLVNGYLHEVPVDVMEAAQTAYEALRGDRDAEVSQLATHRKRGLFGPLVAIR